MSKKRSLHSPVKINYERIWHDGLIQTARVSGRTGESIFIALAFDRERLSRRRTRRGRENEKERKRKKKSDRKEEQWTEHDVQEGLHSTIFFFVFR